VSYTGPVRPSKEQWETFYHRAKDFLNPLQQRGWAFAVNPADEALFKDLLERLVEDDTWVHGKKVPPMITSITVKRGEVMPADPKTTKVVSMRDALQADSGFARFRGLSLPSGIDGLHNPWRRTDHG
jgi:hypothetical protein